MPFVISYSDGERRILEATGILTWPSNVKSLLPYDLNMTFVMYQDRIR